VHAGNTHTKRTIGLKGINTVAKPATNLKTYLSSHEVNDLLRDMNIDVLSAGPTGREITTRLNTGEKNIRK